MAIIFGTRHGQLYRLYSFGLKKFNQNSVDDFYEIISKRYEKGSVTITSNKVFEEWGRIFYDPVLATAILDRFIHHAHFVAIKGESYRMKQREGVIKSMNTMNEKALSRLRGVLCDL
ncbi:ATP-binding protein [Clostridium sp. Marseille-Q7071]